MITISMKDAIPGKSQRRVDVSRHWLYMIRDEDIVLYVGKGYVYDRLSCHLRCTQNTRPSFIGRSILANMPYSLGWVITVYTLVDSREFIRRYNPALINRLDESPWRLEESIDLAEFAMIKYFKPCLNIKGVLTVRN